MSARIGIDAHYLGQHAGGNETHVRNLLRGLRECETDFDIRAYLHPGALDNAEGFQTSRIPFRSSYLRVPVALPLMAARDKLDLLHVQYTAPPTNTCPYVVTMHDAVAFRFPESLPFLVRHRLRHFSGNTLRQARRVFTVTEAMRCELSEVFHIDPKKIDVTPNALGPEMRPVVDSDQLSRVREHYQLPERFILYVGQLQPRKNLARLVEAFIALASQGLPHQLVIVGKPAWAFHDTFAAARKSGLENRIQFTDYVPQEDLPALYTLAEVFAFVSLYEGFGIPVIEALACGTPVLCSTDPALVEVAGGGALHVDPLDIHAITGGLSRLCGEESLRKKLIETGQEHVSRYTPRAVGDAALRGYRNALKY